VFKKKKKGIFPHSPSFLGFWPNQPVHPKVRPSFSPWPSAHGPPTPSLSRGRACWPSSTPHGRAPPPPSLGSLTVLPRSLTCCHPGPACQPSPTSSSCTSRTPPLVSPPSPRVVALPPTQSPGHKYRAAPRRLPIPSLGAAAASSRRHAKP